MDILLSLVNGDVPHAQEEVFKDDIQAEDILTEPHHTTSTDSGQGGITKVLNLKHDTDLSR